MATAAELRIRKLEVKPAAGVMVRACHVEKQEVRHKMKIDMYTKENRLDDERRALVARAPQCKAKGEKMSHGKHVTARGRGCQKSGSSA